MSLSTHGSLPDRQVSLSTHGSLPDSLLCLSTRGSLPDSLVSLSTHGSLPDSLVSLSTHEFLPDSLVSLSTHGSLPDSLVSLSTCGSLPDSLVSLSTRGSLPDHQVSLSFHAALSAAGKGKYTLPVDQVRPHNSVNLGKTFALLWWYNFTRLIYRLFLFPQRANSSQPVCLGCDWLNYCQCLIWLVFNLLLRSALFEQEEYGRNIFFQREIDR